MKKRHVVLFNQLEAYRSHLLAVLNDVTQEGTEVIPRGFRNNIHWNLGHIYLDQYLWIQALTKEKIKSIEDFEQWFGYGTSPSNFTIDTPSFETLIPLLTHQPSVIKEIYGSRLEEEFTPTGMGMHTIEQVLIRTIFHEGMHLQTILDIKKSMSMDSRGIV